MHASVSLHLLCKKRGKGQQTKKRISKKLAKIDAGPGESQNRFPIRDVGLLG